LTAKETGRRYYREKWYLAVGPKNTVMSTKREQIIKAWRDITGQDAIPADRNYWTLCNRQTDDIQELVKMGVIIESQYYGVNQDERIIEKNRNSHPEANWFAGEFLDVIGEHYDQFRPSLVFFSTTSPRAKTAMYLARLMECCPSGTALITNVTHAGKRFESDKLFHGLIRQVPKLWNVGTHYYGDQGSLSYIFWRS